MATRYEVRCTTPYPITAFGGVDFGKQWRPLPSWLDAKEVDDHPNLEVKEVIELSVSEEPSDDKINATPAAIKTAGELGIDLLDVESASLNGRITVGDVKSYAKSIGIEE